MVSEIKLALRTINKSHTKCGTIFKHKKRLGFWGLTPLPARLMSSLILSGVRFVNGTRARINEYAMTLLKFCVVYNGDANNVSRMAGAGGVRATVAGRGGELGSTASLGACDARGRRSHRCQRLTANKTQRCRTRALRCFN